MKKKRLIPLILTSVACFALSFALIGKGTGAATGAVAEETPIDLSLDSFEMYNGSQIRLPVNSGGIQHNNDSLRFMALIDQKQYEDFEKEYGEGAETDTTEWGIVFATREKAESNDLNAQNCFGFGGTQVYGWNAETEDYDAELSTPDKETWVTEELRKNGRIGMFTPTRYDNLEGLSVAHSGGQAFLINNNLSVDGQAGKGYYIISGALVLPEAHYTTEIVARAYVRYEDENGVQYKFADYTGGDMDNNARSMTYVAQAYQDSDEDKTDDEKVYVDNSANGGQNNDVSGYINSTAKVGYTVEYHFVDADGKSIVHTVKVDVPTDPVELEKYKHVINGTIEMTAHEIIDMCQDEELTALVQEYGSQIDWYNPLKLEKSKAYANGRAVFRLYYDNDTYASARKTYDSLAPVTGQSALQVWYYNGNELGVTDKSVAQYDKKYTLGDNVYRPTVCADGHQDGCQHICYKLNCDSPNHGHISQHVQTKLFNNTVLVNATLFDENTRGSKEMQFDGNGKWIGGFTFADYEYILLRLYSNIGGISMSVIVGSNEQGQVVTSNVKYDIQEGWNRIQIDGAAYQKAIEDYVQAYIAANKPYNPNVTWKDALYDDAVNGKYATMAPYRGHKEGMFMQFRVDDSSINADDVAWENAPTWDLYLSDVIGVKSFEKRTNLGYGNFEEFVDGDVANVPAFNFVTSLNTDKNYVYEGKQSLKLVDDRQNMPVDMIDPDGTMTTEDIEKNRSEQWAYVKFKLFKAGKPVTLSQLAQMEITFNLYCTHNVIIWAGGCVWTDAKPLKINAWNKIRINGWRLVDSVLNIATDASISYDETTGYLVVYFAEMPYKTDATYYLDNIKTSYVTEDDQIVELDDFETLPARTNALTTPVWLDSVYSLKPSYKENSSPEDIANYPYWHAIPEHDADDKEDDSVEYFYEVRVNNGTSYSWTTVSENGTTLYHHVDNVEFGWQTFNNEAGFLIGYFGGSGDFAPIPTRGSDVFAVRAVEKTTVGEETTYRYSDWAYYNGVEDVSKQWRHYVENYNNKFPVRSVESEKETRPGVFAVPEVKISKNGVATWADVPYATNGYCYKINNGEAVEYYRKASIVLNNGDSISVRVAAAYAERKNDKNETEFLDSAGNVVCTQKLDKKYYYTEDGVEKCIGDDLSEWSGVSRIAIINASAWSMPIVYEGSVSGKLHSVEKTERTAPLEVEQGVTIYDVAVMKGDAFKEATRIPSPASGGGYAWKIVMGDKQSSGLFLLPLTIGGQPLTNQQLLTAEYIELMVYAGENNRVDGYLNFNGQIPPQEDCTLRPGQWNAIRVPTRDIYQAIQDYKAMLAKGETNINNPYSNGKINRLVGYGLFQITNASKNDYWIIDSARLVYNNKPTHATNASYWFTQQDYDIMPITAYNALMPSQGSITDNKGILDVLAQYHINYDELIQAYVDSGINTMMGLYDFANMTPEGYNFVLQMLEKCAENDLAYLIRWAGSEDLTSDKMLTQTPSYATMRAWMEEIATYSALAGVMLIDEPGASAFNQAVEAREAIERYWGEDALYHVNLFGSYVNKSAMLTYRGPASSNGWWDNAANPYTYEDYVNEFIKVYQPQVLSFDFYPIAGGVSTTVSSNEEVFNDCEDDSKRKIDCYNGATLEMISTGASVTQGLYSYKITMPNESAFNLYTGITAATAGYYDAFMFDVYVESSTTLTWNSWDNLFLQAGKNTVVISVTEYDEIIENEAYSYIRNFTGGEITIYIDNVRATYAYTGSGNYLRAGYFESLALMREAANKANIPFWSYIQTCSWSEGGALPTESELLWNVNTTLAYGAKGIEYFCGVVPPSSNGVDGGEVFDGSLFDKNGMPTDIYGYAKKANMQIQSIDHILMNSKNMGVMFSGALPQFYEVQSNTSYRRLSVAENLAQIPTRGTLESYGGATADGNVLVGCFDYNGKTAYYIVNNSTTNMGGATLSFGVTPYGRTATVYAMNGSGACLVDRADDSVMQTLSNATTGVSVTTNSWDQFYITDMAAGEGILIVMD